MAWGQFWMAWKLFWGMCRQFWRLEGHFWRAWGLWRWLGSSWGRGGGKLMYEKTIFQGYNNPSLTFFLLHVSDRPPLVRLSGQEWPPTRLPHKLGNAELEPVTAVRTTIWWAVHQPLLEGGGGFVLIAIQVQYISNMKTLRYAIYTVCAIKLN
jgi:hypothetical protein